MYKIIQLRFLFNHSKQSTGSQTMYKHVLFTREKKYCNAQIVTRVTLNNGKTCYYPIKYYCCNSIIDELEKLLKKETFPYSCEACRKRDITSGLMADIYDGKLWSEFQTVNGKDFLKAPRNYGLMLNFDFFQPLKRRKDYSVGVFYVAIMNLPRKERFKWENIIVLGVVPSLDKEPKNLNEFLRPAVDELNALWKGVLLKSCISRIPLTFRAAIMCISSDVPATRKLCGFKSHSAELGCSRCLKFFPGNFGEKRDYSGFDRALWEARNHKDHRKLANKMKNCKTIAEGIKLGKKAGIAHYSVLLELDYVDIVRFATIDPMHNLFLGTAKKMYHLWVDNKIMSNKQLKQIENRIGSLDVPNDIGRLPKKISSNSGCYTAEQWKNWTLIYSIYCLKGILPEDHFKCWQAFVLACQRFCKPVISMTDINIADNLIIKFCKSVESIYGKNSITPNMHLHGHLKDIILDHGPVTGYWCFSFERYNGIMGSITSNNRSLELQIMRRFLLSRIFSDKAFLPKDFRDEFSNLCQTKEELSISEETTSWETSYNFQMIPETVPLNEIGWNNFSGITLPKNYKMSHLDADDLELLRKVYAIMFPSKIIQRGNLSEIIHTFGSISINSVKFGSRLDHRTNRSSNILASWSSSDGNIDTTTFILTPGQVKFYFHHSLHLEGEYQIFYFAAVDWYLVDEECNSIGNPVKVWKAKHLKSGPSCFIPIQRIHSRFASVQFKEKGEPKIVVCPIGRKVFL